MRFVRISKTEIQGDQKLPNSFQGPDSGLSVKTRLGNLGQNSEPKKVRRALDILSRTGNCPPGSLGLSGCPGQDFKLSKGRTAIEIQPMGGHFPPGSLGLSGCSGQSFEPMKVRTASDILSRRDNRHPGVCPDVQD
ncbi:unnamed protein product [Caenorhabditis brenneri]